MKSELKLLKVSIFNVLGIVKGLSNEQLNEIPSGYSNNLIWHLAHLLVTQKLLIYGLSNNDLNLEASFIERFRKGSKPNRVISHKSCEEIVQSFNQMYDKLNVDLESKIFIEYKNYPTSYKFEITSLNDAISFNNLHFGLHVSSMLKIKTLIK